MGQDSDNSGNESESARDLLEAALDDLSREEIERKKYDEPERGLDIDPDDYETADTDESSEATGPSEPDFPETPSDDATEQKGSDSEQHQREREMFERAMSDVDRLNKSDKFRSPATPDPDNAADRAEHVGGRTPGDLVTPTLPTSGDELREVPPLDDRQRALKSRYEAWNQSNQTPELNLRGDTTDEAVSRLSSFLAQARHHEAAFVRVVTGRGRRSDGPPALKIAVLEWFEGRGLPYIDGYIPERLMDGDYGSLIVELRQ